MSSKPYECGVCYKNFESGDRCPRILPCSHSLCSICINKIIRSKCVECPFCRTPFTGNSCEDFIINRGLLDIVEMLPQLTIVPETSHMETEETSLESLKEKSRMKLQEETLPVCQKAIAQVQERNRMRDLLKKELTSTIRDIEKGLERLQKLRDFYKRKYEDLEREERELGDTRLVIAMKTSLIYLSDKALESAKDFSSLGSAIDEMISLNKDVMNTASNIENFSSRVEVRDSRIQKNLENCNKHMAVILDVLTKMEKEKRNNFDDLEKEEDECNSSVIPLMTKFRNFSLAEIRKMSPWVETVLEKGWIYSFCNNEGRRLCGVITKESRNRLFLHCLKDNQSLPINARLTKHEDVLRLGRNSKRKTFLEMGVSGDEKKSLGTIVISLEDSGSYPQNFFYLCSGEKGVSYCNTVILKVRDKGNLNEDVVMGDYEKNTGEGGRPVVSMVNWDEEKKNMSKEYQWKSGLVRSWYDWTGKTNSKFRILTRDSPDTRFTGVIIGKVEEGIDVLRNAIFQHLWTQNVEIIDCGIVLHL